MIGYLIPRREEKRVSFHCGDDLTDFSIYCPPVNWPSDPLLDTMRPRTGHQAVSVAEAGVPMIIDYSFFNYRDPNQPGYNTYVIDTFAFRCGLDVMSPCVTKRFSKILRFLTVLSRTTFAQKIQRCRLVIHALRQSG